MMFLKYTLVCPCHNVYECMNGNLSHVSLSVSHMPLPLASKSRLTTFFKSGSSTNTFAASDNLEEMV